MQSAKQSKGLQTKKKTKHNNEFRFFVSVIRKKKTVDSLGYRRLLAIIDNSVNGICTSNAIKWRRRKTREQHTYIWSFKSFQTIVCFSLPAASNYYYFKKIQIEKNNCHKKKKTKQRKQRSHDITTFLKATHRKQRHTRSKANHARQCAEPILNQRRVPTSNDFYFF